MTLDSLEIDLGSSVFTEGQAYTGLSRARSLSSVKIIKLQKRSFKTNEDVIEFYNKFK
jgi:ATP-dependent exoDNAse (exonuclease V) alpha subunit